MEIDAASDAANMPWPAAREGERVTAFLEDAAPNTCITCMVDAARRRMNRFMKRRGHVNHVHSMPFRAACRAGLQQV